MFLVILAFPVYSQQSVSIYRGASAEAAGRSENRSAVFSLNLKDFSEHETTDAAEGGILTAVMVDAVVKKAVDQLLEDSNFVLIENSVISREGSDGGAYGFRWDDYGFEMVFMLEKPGAELFSEIEAVYTGDAYIAGEVKRSYSDNYVVRVLKAENVIDPQQPNIDITEAVLSASVIGSRFQPLLGIHNGLGVLDDLGLAAAGMSARRHELAEYRKIENSEEELLSFIHKIDGMQGDFVENLQRLISDICRKVPDEGVLKLPEEFFMDKMGSNSDFALFYYDILKRKGYNVKFIVIDSGGLESKLLTTVFFREKGSDLWGWIDGRELVREKSAVWYRMPALVTESSVSFFEPDIDEIFSTGRIVLPPPSAWQQALY